MITQSFTHLFFRGIWLLPKGIATPRANHVPKGTWFKLFPRGIWLLLRGTWFRLFFKGIWLFPKRIHFKLFLGGIWLIPRGTRCKLLTRELFPRGIVPLGTHWLALGGTIPLGNNLNRVPPRNNHVPTRSKCN